MSLATKSRIIVLHLTKYSDSSLILHAVDSQEGRKSFLVRGVKSGKHSTADFHSLNILDIVSGSSPKSNISFLKEWEPVATLSDIRSDISKSTVALFISEVIYRSLRTENSDPQLFEWLCSAISKLETTEGSIANFHLWFLASYCSKMGFEPAGSFEPRSVFSPEDLALLDKVMSSSLEQTLALPLSAQRRQSFSRKMLQYLSYHLGAEINVRSLDVLHEIFA